MHIFTGILNPLLQPLQASPPNWLEASMWTKPAPVLTPLWGVGASMIIFLVATATISSTVKAATIGWQTVRVTDLDISGSLAAAIADVAEILVVRGHAAAACDARPRTACGPLPRLHGRADLVNP